MPGGTLQKAVLREDANVLRKIGVIDATRLQVEHLGREQCSQANRARRTDDDFAKFFSLNVVEHLENGRKAQFLQFVLRQLKLADWPEVLDLNVVDVQFASRSDDAQFFSCRRPGRGLFADRRRDAVAVFERTGEPGALAFL